MVAQQKIRASVVGATGYTGQELVRLLANHQHVQLQSVTSRTYAGKKLSEVFPNLRKTIPLVCDECNIDDIAANADVVFLALPHGEAASMLTEKVLEKTKVIDLGADFRLTDPAQYKEWYHTEHANPSLISSAAYGLSELNGTSIAASRLIANPGCYATCSILALTPLLKHNLIKTDSVIIDAKSGISGAGRSLSLNSHFNECNESIKAYAVASHRHTPEIEQELGRQCGQQIALSFTPHLIPMNRGILVTAYATLLPGAEYATVQGAYQEEYGDSYFIRLYDPETDGAQLPETRWVTGSNFCDISFNIDKRTGRVIVIAALDNLVKGAAGQAVQNMNIMQGLPESTGLDYVPVFP